jgi:hypothetical protein
MIVLHDVTSKQGTRTQKTPTLVCDSKKSLEELRSIQIEDGSATCNR